MNKVGIWLSAIGFTFLLANPFPLVIAAIAHAVIHKNEQVIEECEAKLPGKINTVGWRMESCGMGLALLILGLFIFAIAVFGEETMTEFANALSDQTGRLERSLNDSR